MTCFSKEADPRLLAYVEDAISNEASHANIYELLGIRKVFRLMDSYDLNTLMLADDALPAALEKLNTDFTRMHISPGGAADMLALTIFVASLQ